MGNVVKNGFINTINRKLVIQDKFSEMGLLLETNKLFGLGLSNREFRLKTDATYTLWSKGRHETMDEDTGLGGFQGAQSFPFILG